LLNALGMTHREHFRSTYLKPALDAGLVEMTLPDKPDSSHQCYRLTALGQCWLDTLRPPKKPRLDYSGRGSRQRAGG